MCASVLLLSETRSRGRNGGECTGGRERGRDDDGDDGEAEGGTGGLTVTTRMHQSH